MASTIEDQYLDPGANLNSLMKILENKGFEIIQNQNYGAGQVDLVCKISVHPSLPPINCGFIVLRSEERDSKDYEDNQFSIRKIEEAMMRGIRSGLDKVYLIASNEEIAKSVSGKIEWLSSFGSLLRFDAISLGMFPTQQTPVVITPSQRRVPAGEKIRKQKIKEREYKIRKYSTPKGSKKTKSTKQKKDILRTGRKKHGKSKPLRR